MEALTAEFLGKEITLVDNNGIAYVAMREIVEGIGLAWKPQYKKLMDHSQKFSCYHMTTTGKDGKKYEMLCMPIKKLNGWLFSINPNKVRADLKQRLEEYQEECFLALWDYWTEGIARRDEIKNKMIAWQEKKTAYLSVEEADAYHNLRMSKETWAALDEEEKARRLVSASDFLDVNYRFMGEKADPM